MTVLPAPEWKLVTTSDKISNPWYQYFRYADDTWRNEVVSLTSLSTLTLLTNNGVSVLNADPATTYTLEAPIRGCQKTICVVSTSSAGKITLPSTAMFFRNQSTVAGTTGWKLVFSSTAPYKAVELVGISTSEYLIVSNIGTVAVATT